MALEYESDELVAFPAFYMSFSGFSHNALRYSSTLTLRQSTAMVDGGGGLSFVLLACRLIIPGLLVMAFATYPSALGPETIPTTSLHAYLIHSSRIV
jgi:hypothetical protein